MAAFDVDLTTGILSVDDAELTYPADTDLINGEINLLIDGYGVYTLEQGNVFVDGSGYVQPSRQITARGTMILTDGTIISLTDEDIVRFSVSTDVGAFPPIGATPSANYTLILSNLWGQWDENGSVLKGKKLDGAVVYLETGAISGDPTLYVLSSYLDGELILTGSDEAGLFSMVDGEIVYSGSIDYVIIDGYLYLDEFTGAYEYSAIGRFVVNKIDNQEYSTIITLSGTDYMANRMMTEYVDGNSYPATYQTIIADACEQAGIHLKGYSVDYLGVVTYDSFTYDDEEITEAPVFEANRITTCRDVVGWIAMMAGANAVINSDGELEIRPLDAVGQSVNPDRYFKLTANTSYESYKLYLYEYGAPSGTAPLEVVFGSEPYYIMEIRDNPYLSYALASHASVNQAILDDRINAVALWVIGRTSAEIEWPGDGLCKILDTLSIERLDGIVIQVGVLQQTIEHDMGLRYESGCDLSTATLSNAFIPYRG